MPKLPKKAVASSSLKLESYSQQALSIFQPSLENPKVEKNKIKSQNIHTPSAAIAANVPVRCICIICGKNYYESSVALAELKYKCQDCTVDRFYGLSVSQKFKKLCGFPKWHFFFNCSLNWDNRAVCTQLDL